MFKYISKIFIIFCFFITISTNLFYVSAEPTENSQNLADSTVSNAQTNISNEENLENENNDNNNEEISNDIHSEKSDSLGQVQQSSSDNMDITSIRTINGLPEANLKLNNILNIILISIGILLILLAIALLIRLKK